LTRPQTGQITELRINTFTNIFVTKLNNWEHGRRQRGAMAPLDFLTWYW